MLRHESETSSKTMICSSIAQEKKHIKPRTSNQKVGNDESKHRRSQEAQTPYRAAKRSRMTGGNDAI